MLQFQTPVLRKFRNKIKRVIVTSSVAAVGFTSAPPTVTFDESHWNDQAVELTNALGKEAPPMVKYSASKVLAEKGLQFARYRHLLVFISLYTPKPAAWDFYNKLKSELQWELVTILPSHVCPSFHERCLV